MQEVAQSLGERTLIIPNFAEFLKILAEGNPNAVSELLQQIDPWIRKIIRLHLTDGRVRRVVQTTDVIQSLYKDFLQRSRPEAPDEKIQLEEYLAGAVRRKILGKFRKERRTRDDDFAFALVESTDAAIAELVADNDYVAMVRGRLNEECRRLLDLRMNDFTWPEVSAITGKRPDAARIRLRRSVAAVIRQMNCGDAASHGQP